MTLHDALTRATISVPEAGRVFFDLGRNAAYDAARRGDIPTIELRGKKRVPVAQIAQRLGLSMQLGEAA